MQPQSEEAALDICIDLLLEGCDWEPGLPGEPQARVEVRSLMAVAVQLARTAAASGKLGEAQRRRIWNRVEARVNARNSRIKAIALYRLPYLPPLWIRPEPI